LFSGYRLLRPGERPVDNVADGWTLPSESVLDSTRLQSRNRSREIEADGEVHIRHAGDIRRLPH